MHSISAAKPRCRGTGCADCARPGLWGSRPGNRRLYPERGLVSHFEEMGNYSPLDFLSFFLSFYPFVLVDALFIKSRQDERDLIGCSL